MKKKEILFGEYERVYFEGKVLVDTKELFDACEGYLYITNQRIILDSKKKNLDVKVEEIQSCRKIFGAVEVTIHDIAYKIYTTKANIIKDLLDRMLSDLKAFYDLKPFVQESIELDTEDFPYETIKELTTQLHNGEISQEEYEAKRKELLGI